MAAPQPRKFGEKIALLQQQAIESAAAFDSVMSEVKCITRQARMSAAVASHSPGHGLSNVGTPLCTSVASPQQQQLSQHTSPTRHALPGVNDFSINVLHNNSGLRSWRQDGVQEAVNDLQSLTEEVYHRAPHSTISSSSAVTCHSRHHSPHNPHHRGSASPVGRTAGILKGGAVVVTSGGVHHPTHLSPPPDALPRSNSVPSLHQHLSSSYPVSTPHDDARILTQGHYKSLLDVSPHHHSVHSRISNTNVIGATVNSGSTLLLQGPLQQQFHGNNVGSGGGPGGTNCGLISLANTGSLPDLTIREPQQPSNLHTLPGVENGQYPCNLPNGPYNALPPTSSPQRQSPQSGTSPGPSPSLSRRQKPKPYPPPPSRATAVSSQNLLSVPVATVVNSNFLHTCKGTVQVDHGAIDVPNVGGAPVIFPSSPPFNSLFNPLAGGGGSIPSSPNQQLINGGVMHSSLGHGNMQQLHFQQRFNVYRDPPSPQLSPRSSPGPVLVQTAGAAPGSVGCVYRSASPDSRSSAPPSPICIPSQASPSPVSSPGVTISKNFNYENISTYTSLPPNQVHDQFEQMSVIDHPVNNIDTRTSQHQQIFVQSAVELGADSNLYSSTNSSYQPVTLVGNNQAQQPLTSMVTPQLPPLNQLPSSPLQQPPASPTPSLGPHSPATPGGGCGGQGGLNMNPATPQTPNSIPKLVLTDHDGNNDILKEFNSVGLDENLQFFLSQFSDVDDIGIYNSLIEDDGDPPL